MQNKILTWGLVIIIGVSLGVVILSKKGPSPQMQELIQQQVETVHILKNIEEGMSGEEKRKRDLSAILVTLQDLQQRVTALEAKAGGVGGDVIRNFPQRPQEDYTKEYTISAAHSPVRGPKDAPVTIVEFVDFQCPFCARFHPPIQEVLETYPKEVNYVLKNFPLSFHPQAKPAAKAAFAAGEQGKYWEMADAILKDNSNLSEDRFKQLAQDLGLNVDKFLKDYKDKDAQWEEWIAADMALGGEVDVRGTPTFYLNGKKTGARDFSSYKKEIDAILKK